MTTQREIKILTDAIKEQSGLDISSDAALTALYAVANYNYGLIPQKPEPQYKTGVAPLRHQRRCLRATRPRATPLTVSAVWILLEHLRPLRRLQDKDALSHIGSM